MNGITINNSTNHKKDNKDVKNLGPVCLNALVQNKKKLAFTLAERARKQFSQEKLAEMADITPEYLARIEKEKYSPSLIVIVNLALALNISVDKLIPLDKIK